MKNILLIGLGRFGKHIAMQLNEMGHEIMAVDINEERVKQNPSFCHQCPDWRQYRCQFPGITGNRKF